MKRSNVSYQLFNFSKGIYFFFFTYYFSFFPLHLFKKNLKKKKSKSLKLLYFYFQNLLYYLILYIWKHNVCNFYLFFYFYLIIFQNKENIFSICICALFFLSKISLIACWNNHYFVVNVSLMTRFTLIWFSFLFSIWQWIGVIRKRTFYISKTKHGSHFR